MAEIEEEEEERPPRAHSHEIDFTGEYAGEYPTVRELQRLDRDQWQEPGPRPGWMGSLIRCAWKVFKGAEFLGDKLADILGLNDSRYQWVVDEYVAMKEEEERERLEREEAEAEELSDLEGGAALEPTPHPPTSNIVEMAAAATHVDSYVGTDGVGAQSSTVSLSDISATVNTV